jgi:uncharacterized membrane protein YfcA
MNPFDWKNNPILLLFVMPIIALCVGLGIHLGHSLLSVVLSVAVILVAVIYLFIRKEDRTKR